MSQASAEPPMETEALFVQSATRLSSGGGSVTLHGLSPSTIYFADQPQREVGHLTTKHFIQLWPEGEHSFAADPPNAVLSFIDRDGQPPQDAVVVLADPILTGDVLTYKVEVLEGNLPSTAESCSIFIDAFGRPLSSASLAGMRRRERRPVRSGPGPSSASSR
jgi:hypothetical protein